MFREGPKYELVMQTQCLEVVCLVKTKTVWMPAMLALHCVLQGLYLGDVNLSRLLSTNCTANSQGRAVYVRNRRGNNHKAVVRSMALWVKHHQIIIKHMWEVIKRNERSEETGKAILCGQHNMLCSAESRAICVLGCSGLKCLSIYGIRSTFLKRIHSTDMEVALWVVKTIQWFFCRAS